MTVRPGIDVSRLPTTVFGARSLTWWGTLGFMAVEGTTLATACVALLYLWHMAPDWPPGAAPRPDVLLPTINLAIMLGSIALARRIEHAALRMDLAGTRRWMVAAGVTSLVILVLRGFEFAGLGTSWDQSAYGSVLWAVLTVHTLLLLTDALESWAMTAVFFIGPVEAKHFVDASDSAFYWNFAATSWVVPYLLVYWLPAW